jgi:glycosyltransferase involved in cell wall biosynthesis
LQIILVGNYAPDGQQSMLRFANALERGLRGRGCSVSVLQPRAILGPSTAGRFVSKWCGYADKFLLFPWTLRSALRRARRNGSAVVVHVCDHSNAIYTKYLRGVPNVVTCNDLLAVRSALGEIPENPTRWSGRILQRLILAGLNRAQHVACISEATLQDVLRLSSMSGDAVHLVPMGLNWPYAPVNADEADVQIRHLLARIGDRPSESRRPFILHVGGNQWYKNRLGVLRIYAELKAIAGNSMPALFMVGARFTTPMRKFVAERGLGDDVVELVGVANDELAALYSRAELLLFPSLAEGFGWPVVEAMACGCVVVTSDRRPLTDIGGAAAVYIDPGEVDAAARVIRDTLDEAPAIRQARVTRGLVQQRQFSDDMMIRRYLDLYRSALAGGSLAKPT